MENLFVQVIIRFFLVYLFTISFYNISAQSSYCDSLMSIAVEKENQKDYDGAINAFSEIIKVKPSDTISYLHRGLCYFILDDLKLAYEDLTKVILLDSLNYEAFHGRANVLIMGDEIDKGIADFNKAISINPFFTDALYNRGYLFYQINEIELAFEDINKVLELDSLDVDARFTRGMLWKEKKEYQLAIEDFNLVIEIDQSYYDAYFERGLCFKDSENYEMSLNDFLLLHGKRYYDKGEVLKNIAHNYYKLDNYDQCCVYLSELFLNGYSKKELLKFYDETCL